MTRPTATTIDELARRFAAADALDAPLDRKLADYASRSREVIPEVLEAYDRFVARLEANGTERNVPRAGGELPEFVLPDRDGKLVALSDLLAMGPVVVSINRGHWCPYCRLELRALARVSRQLEAQGARIVSIVPETAAMAARMVESQALPFPVLSDMDLGYALSIGLAVWAGEEMIACYRAYGIDLPRFQGNDGWLLPIPGTFVVDAGRRIRAAFVEVDFRKRMTIEEIEAALGA